MMIKVNKDTWINPRHVESIHNRVEIPGVVLMVSGTEHAIENAATKQILLEKVWA